MESFDVSYDSDPAGLSAAAAGLTRFERMRTIPGLVVPAVGAGFVYSLGSPSLSIVCVVAFAAAAVLSIRWFARAARVGKAARSYQGPTTVVVSSDGLELSRGGAVAVKTRWNEVAVCTNTNDCWIFVPRKSKEIIFLPQQGMDAAQRQ